MGKPHFEGGGLEGGGGVGRVSEDLEEAPGLDLDFLDVRFSFYFRSGVLMEIVLFSRLFSSLW